MSDFNQNTDILIHPEKNLYRPDDSNNCKSVSNKDSNVSKFCVRDSVINVQYSYVTNRHVHQHFTPQDAINS